MISKPSLSLFCQGWTAPKDGNSTEQNEDAHRIELMQGASAPEGVLIAVADGATEAIYSRLWAQTLVGASEAEWLALNDEDLNEKLDMTRKAFSPLDLASEVPWFVRNKYLSQGSQATLLLATAMTGAEQESVRVRGMAVGDCCLMLFTLGGSVYTFPVTSSDDFGVDPTLIRNLRQPTLQYARCEARLGSGDFLLVATDAVGKWVFQCIESNESGILFDSLLGLLAPAPCDENSPQNDCGIAGVAHLDPLATPPPKPISASVKAIHPGLLKRIWAFLAKPRSLVHLRGLNHSPEVCQNQSECLETERVPALGFEQFINTSRSPESQPRMRNDDATLILCIPVSGGMNDQREEALSILQRYRQLAGEGPLVVHPMADLPREW
jgi:hypothetical protein